MQKYIKITIIRGFSMKIIRHKNHATCFLTMPCGIYKNQANIKEKGKRERVNKEITGVIASHRKLSEDNGQMPRCLIVHL